MTTKPQNMMMCEEKSRIADIPKFNSPVSPVKSLQRDFLEIKTSSYPNGWKSKAINNALTKLLLRLEEIFKLFNEPPRTARLKLALTSSDPQAEFMSKEHREARDETFDIMPNRLDAMLQLFRALLKKPSDELRWSIQFKDIAPVISLGLANPNTKQLAVECKDLLLKMGFSDFLNLGNEEGK